MNLQGKHILITRPEPENQISCLFFQTAGAKVTSLPMLSITPLSEKEASIRAQIFELDQYNKVIFISKNAVRHGVEWIDYCWPQLPIGIQWVGIGEGTTTLLNELGSTLGIQAKHTPFIGKNGDLNISENLLSQPEFQTIQGERILIIKGEGGRQLLASTLSERGAQVNELALYKRDKITYSLVKIRTAATADFICVTSTESLENLTTILANLAQDWFKKILVVPSQRVAQEAKKMGWEHIINAHGADDKSLMAAISDL
ncbi:uroporphyrinogen-III synthase [Marinomonas agarivorans]|nr:uroporphyrinogen-III synthase [Marinomonas agarivorans]